MKKHYSKLWILFKSMFVLSMCTFGGGFVIVSLMKKRFVEELKWIEEEEMLDVTAITQSAPGPLMTNAAVIVGYRIAGIVGALTAIAGSILPPMIIISIISIFYEQFCTNSYVAMALQVMPYSRSSMAAARVRPTTPALAAQYSACLRTSPMKARADVAMEASTWMVAFSDGGT